MPTLLLQLSSIDGHRSTEVLAGVDTGFDGLLAIPFSIFNQIDLMSSRIPGDQSAYGETASGERVEFTSSYALMTVPNLLNEVQIEVDTFTGCSLPIVGRQLLGLFNTLLKGAEEEAEYTLNGLL